MLQWLLPKVIEMKEAGGLARAGRAGKQDEGWFLQMKEIHNISYPMNSYDIQQKYTKMKTSPQGILWYPIKS